MRISDWSSDVCSSDLDVLIGAAAFAAAGLAWRLTPKRTLDLVSDEKLAEIVPAAFGLWSSRPSTQLVQPKTEGTLSAMLYSDRSEEHTSELQSLMRISYAVFCLKKKKKQKQDNNVERELSRNKRKE